MDDTTADVKKEMKERLMRLSGEQRIRMGASMFDASRRMVLSSLSRDLADREISENLFLRFYKDDFSPSERERIIQYLKNRD